MKPYKLSSILSALLVVSAAAFSSNAFADAAVGAGGAPNTAQARLDFTVVIPKVLQFRVGTNVAGTVDMITFTPTIANLGTGAIAGTGGDGTGPGAVTARVVANSGQVTISATTAGALSDGAAPAHTIAWPTITTAVAIATSAVALPAPLLTNGPAAGPTVNAPAPVANVTVADAKWTFSYSNAAVIAAGTYGGTVAKNGRVTYTASAP